MLLNDGKGGFVASNLGPKADRTYTAALADLDGDGDLDVLTSNDTPDEKLVYLNDGKGRFSVAGTWGVGTWSTRNAAVVDLNGDGRPDVIAANRPGPSYVCLNQGGGRFATSCIPIPAESATSIVAADFDKDGFVDLAVPSRDGGQSRIYFNDGKAGFARTAPFGPPDAAGACRRRRRLRRRRLGRPRGRRREPPRRSWSIINDGKGASRPASASRTRRECRMRLPPATSTTTAAPDIVLGYTKGPHSVFFNDGSGRAFTEVRFGDEQGSAYGFALGDVDRDGFPDIALARSGAPNVLYLSGK